MKNLNIRKLLALYFDWILIALILGIPMVLISPLIFKLPYKTIVFISLVLTVVVYFLFTKRDMLFKGRSLGKRFFNLAVYNELNKELLSLNVLQKRGIIEFFTFPIDFFLILFEGKQIADYVCRTEVRDYKK